MIHKDEKKTIWFRIHQQRYHQQKRVLSSRCVDDLCLRSAMSSFLCKLVSFVCVHPASNLTTKIANKALYIGDTYLMYQSMYILHVPTPCTNPMSQLKGGAKGGVPNGFYWYLQCFGIRTPPLAPPLSWYMGLVHGVGTWGRYIG